jgi:ABC-2 type transport system ATP-binding protein
MTTAIEVRGLVKTYGATRAVDDVSFAVAEGEVMAILGPNGAGKSTTVEILEGHRDRDAGDVRVLGVDPASGGRAFRDRIGIVLQSSAMDPELTVRELMDMYGAAYSKRRPSDEVMELVELGEKADDRIVSLSGGQQRRVDLALGLVGDPELIFLDEPTTGFDPAARRRSWDLVENLTSLGRTIVLTTHYLDEAEHLADRVIVLAGGRVVAEGTPAQLRADSARETRITFRLPSLAEPVTGLLEAVQGEVIGRGQGVEILTRTPTADLAHVTGWAATRGVELDALTVESPGLEDAYLRLVGEDAGASVEAQPSDRDGR